VVSTVTPIAVFKHTAFAPGTACDAAGCHTPDYFKPPFTHKEPYLGPCEPCHNLVDWKQVKYKHKDTSFDNGMHPLIGCAMCHTEGQPLPNPACTTCHPEAPHKGWTKCAGCHSTLAWSMRKPLPVGHLSLKGGHSKLECFDCHKAPTAPAKTRTCTDCHGTNHGGLTTCQDCHDPATGWEPKPGWSHSDFFVISGQHKKLECADCHKHEKFAGTPRICVGCHGSKHGGLTDCARCHTPAGFDPSKFRHSSVFKLVKGHAELKCSRCHPSNLYATTKNNAGKSCTGCHQPKHGGLVNCGRCHLSGDPNPSLFHHSVLFPLVGHHDIPCSSCHAGNIFVPAPSDRCVDCHGAVSPHGSQITQCGDCHSPANSLANGWAFVHVTGHPIQLGGHHAGTASCTAPNGCHPSLVFSDPTIACVSCHAATVAAAHVGPTDCKQCHNATTWPDIHFTHVYPIVNPSDNTTSPHTWHDFGQYPSGCIDCHQGPGPQVDFLVVTCKVCH
jgi:hypothetical protein